MIPFFIDVLRIAARRLMRRLVIYAVRQLRQHAFV
jgi:hypothetical protein